jgi:predicted NACHT family NTPase
MIWLTKILAEKQDNLLKEGISSNSEAITFTTEIQSIIMPASPAVTRYNVVLLLTFFSKVKLNLKTFPPAIHHESRQCIIIS